MGQSAQENTADADYEALVTRGAALRPRINVALTALLGEGSFGRSRASWRDGRDDQICVKRCRLTTCPAPSSASYAARSACTLSSHPNLNAYGAFVFDGHLHVVLHRCAGDLATALAEGADLRGTRHPLRQLLLALAHLHERNVAHHDVKPSNLLSTATAAAALRPWRGGARARPRPLHASRLPATSRPRRLRSRTSRCSNAAPATRRRRTCGARASSWSSFSPAECRSQRRRSTRRRSRRPSSSGRRRSSPPRPLLEARAPLSSNYCRSSRSRGRRRRKRCALPTSLATTTTTSTTSPTASSGSAARASCCRRGRPPPLPPPPHRPSQSTTRRRRRRRRRPRRATMARRQHRGARARPPEPARARGLRLRV